MSHDAGYASARRPRETLGTLNANTGIPAPNSTMKRPNPNNPGFGTASHVRTTSGSRQSLAGMPRPSQPMFQRTSSGTNLVDAGLASVRRASINPRGGFAGTGNNATARISTDGDRRSSIFRPRQSTIAPVTHQSFFQTTPQPAGVPRDPRPLRDRAYQAKIGQELLDYMGKNNFEIEMKHVLSQNVMRSPTQKDFNYMFQWLYHRIDPSYRFQRNIDQEVPPILKQLRYPFERSLTKSQIAAVGGQNWSTFLGLLHWMMQLAEMLEGYSSNRYDDACADAGVDITGDHIIFDFLSGAYRDWLAMDEEAGDEDAEQVLAPHVEEMAAAFTRSTARYTQELETLEAENARLLKEIEDLEQSTPDPATLDDHFKIMEKDKANFEDYNNLATQRSEKYEHRAGILQEELEKLHEEIKTAEEERRSLQQSVDAIGISMSDIDRMTSERERLQKGIEVSSQKLEELKKRAAETEAEASQRLDQLEQQVDMYNTLAYKIALIPASAANARGRDFELRVSINNNSDFTASNMNGPSTDRLLADSANGYQPGHILNLDLKGQMRSSFLQLRKEISERRSAAMDEMLKDHELLDGIKEAIEDKRNEVEALNHRVRAAEEEHEKTREVTNTQKMGSDAQIEKMEKDLSRIRAGLSESVQLLEQREINTTIEYEQLLVHAGALREELHTEIDRMLNDVIKFKIHIQKNLDDYEGFVADELEKELGVDDMNDDTRQLDL